MTLVREAMDGDGPARERLLERLRPRLVLWIATRMSSTLRAHADAEDVAQEVLLAVHRDLDRGRFDADRGFYAWLFRIAENRLRDLADYAGARRRTPRKLPDRTRTTPSQAAIRTEASLRLREALEILCEDHREVIRLRRLEERETAEVARILGRSEGAVRVLYCRAMKVLGRILREREGPAVSP